ncbi:hypothetical protein B0H16DRAFT_1813598 [Mycena metata]|uniref:Transmembrane protein n=1 Tax=Mycena metata TaxID=1033252 RepID=A0AAD7JBD6_9AGAR|nr:hypothetical protein B0H16DRAFT_1813598 [Mycena metata]
MICPYFLDLVVCFPFLLFSYAQMAPLRSPSSTLFVPFQPQRRRLPSDSRVSPAVEGLLASAVCLGLCVSVDALPRRSLCASPASITLAITGYCLREVVSGSFWSGLVANTGILLFLCSSFLRPGTSRGRGSLFAYFLGAFLAFLLFISDVRGAPCLVCCKVCFDPQVMWPNRFGLLSQLGPCC